MIIPLNSNPDNIIDGLSVSLKRHFNVEFSATKSPLPEGYVLSGGQVFKYNEEDNNIYYGDQAWAQNGQIHTVDRGRGDALFDGFLFDNQTKTLKKIDPQSWDSFADDFNRCYGGNKSLCVDQHGNLTLDGDILIGAEKSRIRTLSLPALTTMGNYSLCRANALTRFDAPALTTMGNGGLCRAVALMSFEAPALTTMGNFCFSQVDALTQFKASALTTMGLHCLCYADALTRFEAPALTTMGNNCLYSVRALPRFEAPALITMGDNCLCGAAALTRFETPAHTTMGHGCLQYASVSLKCRWLPRWAKTTLCTLGI